MKRMIVHQHQHRSLGTSLICNNCRSALIHKVFSPLFVEPVKLGQKGNPLP